MLSSENTYGKYMHKYFKNILNIPIPRMFKSSCLDVFNCVQLKNFIKFTGKHIHENI